MKNLTRDIQTSAEELKTLTFSICSEAPYTKYTEEDGEYDEILRISDDSVDFSRLNSGACAFLKDHDKKFVLGVITKAWIQDFKVYVNVKFSERAEKYVKDIETGIQTCTSIGYNIEQYHWEAINGRKSLIADRFLIYEASLVGVPADITVGYNRSLDIPNLIDGVEITDDEIKACVDELVAKKKACTEEAKKEAEAEAEAKALEEAEAKKKECEQEEAEKARAAEIEEIRSLGAIVEQNELAETFIKKNRTLVEFKNEIKSIKEKLNVKENKSMDKKFSLTKALNLYTKNFKGNLEDAYEYQISEENKRALNITDDAQIVVTRDQLRAFPNGSEVLNQTEYRPDLYTEELRPQSVIAKTGCRVVDVAGPSISFSVATSGVNAGFVDVNGEIPSADMAWVLKTLAPKKLGAYVEIDYKALLQDRPSIEAIIVDDVVKGLDQAKDEAMLIGDGTGNKPTGILGTSGINEAPISSAFTLSGVYGMEKLIRDSNDYTEDLTFVCNSKNYYKFATTAYSAVEQNRMLLEDGKMIGHPVIICNALNDNTIILGNFSELLVAQFDGMRLKVVEDAGLSRKGAVEVQAFETFDCLCRRPKSFTVTKA